jgi:hypothetical protein
MWSGSYAESEESAEPWSFPASDPLITQLASTDWGHGTLHSDNVDNIWLTELPLANTIGTGDSVVPVEATGLSHSDLMTLHGTNVLVTAPSRVIKSTNSPLFFEDSSQSQGTSVSELINEVRGDANRVDVSQVWTDDRLSQDALICPMAEGWDAVECYSYFCPRWNNPRSSAVESGGFISNNVDFAMDSLVESRSPRRWPSCAHKTPCKPAGRLASKAVTLNRQC